MMAEKLSREEFERRWCERARMTLAEARAMGFETSPCDCEDYDGCEGWCVNISLAKLAAFRRGEGVR